MHVSHSAHVSQCLRLYELLELRKLETKVQLEEEVVKLRARAEAELNDLKSKSGDGEFLRGLQKGLHGLQEEVDAMDAQIKDHDTASADIEAQIAELSTVLQEKKLKYNEVKDLWQEAINAKLVAEKITIQAEAELDNGKNKAGDTVVKLKFDAEHLQEKLKELSEQLAAKYCIAELRLVDSSVAEYEADKIGFANKFRGDLSNGLDIEPTDIEIVEVSEGSLKVKYKMKDKNGDMEQKMRDLHADPDGILYEGQVTHSADPNFLEFHGKSAEEILADIVIQAEAEMPECDDENEGEVNIGLNVTAGLDVDVDVKVGLDLDVDVKAGLDVDVDVKAGLDLDVSVKGPSLDISAKAPSLDVGLEVKAPSLDLDVDVKVGLDLDVSVKGPSLDISAKAPSLDVGLEVKAPSLDVGLDVKAPSLDLDVDVKAGLDLDVSVKGPSLEISAKAPSLDVGLEVKGSLDMKAPDMPSVEGGVSLDVKGPSLDLSLDVKADVDVDVKAGVDVDLKGPKVDADMKGPELEVNFNIDELGGKVAAGMSEEELKAGANVSIPSQDVEGVHLPAMNVDVCNAVLMCCMIPKSRSKIGQRFKKALASGGLHTAGEAGKDKFAASVKRANSPERREGPSLDVEEEKAKEVSQLKI